MKTNLSLFISLLFLTPAAFAHPLGNFSVNQYSLLEVERSQIKLRQILDLAEIPTFQLRPEIDSNKNGHMSDDEIHLYAEKITPQILAGLYLTLNGEPVAVRGEPQRVSLAAGTGDLPTLRIEWIISGHFSNPRTANRIQFENRNFAGRPGWNEIVVTRPAGLYVFASNAFGSGVSDELKAYPQNSLDAPLNERSAQFSFSVDPPPASAELLQQRDGQLSAPVQKDKLAELIAVPEITPAIALFGLLIACGLGAMHAMSPGHGKTVVGAYLVGSRGTIRHAMFLGLTVTVTHTLGVFGLGLITLFASNYVLPEKLLPFLGFVSGLLVLYLGLTMFKSRLFSILGWNAAARHHEHSHDGHIHFHPPAVEGGAAVPGDGNTHSSAAFAHTHDDHTHSHRPPDEISWKSLLALGISGGLLPCPSALVLMLSAISLGRPGYGLVLTTAFSFGLAATLTGVGLVFLYLGKLFSNPALGENRLIKTVPVVSAFVIACLGAVICYNSLG